MSSTNNEALAAFAPILEPEMNRLREMLLFLKDNLPQVLIFEGGDRNSRMSAALWQAALMHCQSPKASGPCLHCPACLRLDAGADRDVLAYDGGISNKEEEENTGFVRAFNMENVRALKRVLAQAPHEAERRVVILSGLDQTREEAANALLKVLEEPSETTIFILLTPQRDQLLPTLVSRGWVVGLPWRHSGSFSSRPGLADWENELASFLHSGRGWFRLTSGKGAVSPELASDIISSCRRALITASAGESVGNTVPLAIFFRENMDDASRFAAGDFLRKAEEALRFAVAPARVVEWLAVRLHGRANN